MGYKKYHLKVPDVNDYLDFYNLGNFVIDNNKLWKSFYNDIKDPLWPKCNSFDDIDNLPKYIKNEILETYQPPDKLVNNSNFMSLLCISFYDHYKSYKIQSNYGGDVILLDDYLTSISNNTDMKFLSDVVVKRMKWEWNEDSSKVFGKHVYTNNKQYFKWLKKIKTIYNNIINNEIINIDLTFWEKSVVIFLLCEKYNIHPKTLEWQRIGLFESSDDILSLISN